MNKQQRNERIGVATFIAASALGGAVMLHGSSPEQIGNDHTVYSQPGDTLTSAIGRVCGDAAGDNEFSYNASRYESDILAPDGEIRTDPTKMQPGDTIIIHCME